MKILILTAEPPWPLDQGDKLRNYYILKALSAEHEVTLVCFCPPEEKDGVWRERLSPFCSEIFALPLGRNSMLANVIKSPFMPFTMATRSSSRMAGFVRELTSKRKYDLSLACQLKMSGYLKYCATDKKVAELTDALTLYKKRMASLEKSPGKMILSSLEKTRLGYWEKKIMNGVDLSIVVSADDEEFLQKIAPEACLAAVPNGVALDYFAPLPQVNHPVIIFYGHLRYPPNADGAVWFGRKVYPLIREAMPGVEWLIVGKEPTPAVSAMATLPGVKLTGYVPDIRSYLEQAALMAVPLRFGAGMRNKILEAMAAGRAVVSTSLGCEGLAVEPGVHLEVADDPEAFADSVIGLLKDHAARKILAANSRRLVEKKYGWDSIEGRYREKIRALVKQ